MGNHLTCPSCGAPIELKYRFSKMAVCDSCKQTSFLENNQLSAAGDKKELANYGSKFAVGAKGTIKESPFTIIGRIRFEYSGGFWDEWLIQLGNNNDTEFWLHEDEGDIILYKRQKIEEKMPEFSSVEVGVKYAFAGHKIFISEKHKADILGAEGELPFRALPNQQADFVDGIFYGKGTVFSFEFLPEETVFYTGELIRWNDILLEEQKSIY